MKNNKMLYVILFLLFGIFIIAFLINKGSYSVSSTSYTTTRKDLQNIVLSTALSYYYNKNYSDYEQRSLDWKYNDDGTLSRGNTFMWRNFNNSPEMVSRCNPYTIDCGSFVSIVYLYSLGFDLSSYHEVLANNKYYEYTNNKYVLRSSRNSINDFQKTYLSVGKGQATAISNYIETINGENSFANGWNKNSSSEFVYYYKPNTGDNVDEMRNNIISNLRPGDLLVFRRKNISDNNTHGHVVIYVGDLFKNGEKGFIHSGGYDFDLDTTNGRVSTLGDDKYVIKYDTWDNYAKYGIFINDGSQEAISFAIIRPINHYCESGSTASDNDSCVISNSTVTSYMHNNDTEKLNLLINNSNARNELSGLKIEQFQFRGSDSTNLLNKYNSVNNGDVISYRTVIWNMANFGFCSRGEYDTSNECLSSSNTWNTASNINNSYGNLVVSAKIPEGTEYVDGSCYFRVHSTGSTSDDNDYTKCSYSDGTVTWVNTAISADQDAARSFNYKVKVKSNTIKEVTNEGMVIKTKKNALKMGEMTTSVNSTINSSTDISKLQSIIDTKFNDNIQYGSGSSLKFAKDVYNDYLGYELSELSSYNNILNAIFIDLNEDDTTKKAEYHKRIDYSNLNANLRRINDMLVPGEYGGKWLRYNANGDRARILFKNGYKTSLEVGDIIIGFNNSDTNYRNFTSQYVWMFYGYDGNQPIFVRGFKNSDGGTTYVRSDASSAVTGYQVYKEIYAYDLFAVLRPMRVYSSTYKYNIAYKWNGATANDTFPTTAKMLDDVEIPNPTKKVVWSFNANNTGATISKKSLTFNQEFAGWTTSQSNGLSYNALFGSDINSLTTWDGSKTTYTHFKNLASNGETITLIANWISNETVKMPTVTKEGYVCHWNNNSSGNGSLNIVSGGDRLPSEKASSSYTWYAICTKNSLKGDANGDGIVDILDARELAKYIINKKSNYSMEQLLQGDMNGDGKIKMNDVMQLLKTL